MAKVLVVDDDLDVRESLSDWLAREYVVCQAAGVPDALAVIGRERPDIVITDFELPPYRGDDFLATLAEHYPHVGRFMLTGSPGRALGFAYSVAHRVLKKGCDLRELSSAIRDYLRRTAVTDAG
jgi:two-component system response regulator DesR